MGKVREIKDGEEIFIKVNDEDERVTCCDCGLTHDVHYRMVDINTLGVTVWRHNRSTGQHRRHNGRSMV